jgi:hypothetical protein
MSDPLDPQEAATLFYAGHPMAFVATPDEPFVCGQWQGNLAFITKLPFTDPAGAVTYFTDNPVGLAVPPVGASFSVPPVNIDEPYVEQGAAGVCSCTMGNWEDPPPDTYNYRWRLDGAPVSGGTNASTFTATVANVGQTLDCVLTASNSFGSTSADSNQIVIADTGDLGASRRPGRV